VVKPLAELDPLAGREFSCQYEAALAGVGRSAYRPVRTKVSRVLVSRSWTRRTSPGRSLSNAAVLAGSAAGIAPPAAAESPGDAASCAGHRPLTSTA
jgi:hypothetical protein